MANYDLIVPVLASFIATLFLIPRWIKRAKKAGLVGKDVHKEKSEGIPESGGVAVIVGFALGVMLYIAIKTFVFETTANLIETLAMFSSILLITFIAFVDDILGWKIGLRRRTRLVFVALASVPLVAINAGRSIIGLPFVGEVNLGLIYPIFLIPLGIVGATTTFNFLAGFNGLEAGLGIILLSGMAFVAFITGSPWLAIIALCMVAGLVAFLFYNFYPARVFPGDSLTYAIGGLVAIIAILGNFEKIAVFFFLPYIAETALKARGKLVKESFAKLKKDGSLELKENKIYGLTHASIFLMQKLGIKPTEKRVVASLWIVQFAVILLGLIIFRRGIFG